MTSENDLHVDGCKESNADMDRMSKLIARNPEVLENVTTLNEDAILLAEEHYTPLQMAIKSNHLRCVEFLINKGVRYDRAFGYAGDAFCSAILFNSFEILKLLIHTYGMKPSNNRLDYIACKESAMYMHSAVLHGTPQIIQYLLDNGAQTENREFYQHPEGHQILITPVVEAVMHGKYVNLKVLLLNGVITDMERAGFQLDSPKDHDVLSLPLRIGLSFLNILELKIKISKLLYDFGVNLLKPASTNENLIDILRSNEIRDRMKSYLDIRGFGTGGLALENEDRERLAHFILSLYATPMSLKAQCRISIYQRIGRDYLHKVELLFDSLPRELQDYLLFN